MKRLVCAILFCSIAITASAQLRDFGYVFPEFETAIIQQKSGPPLEASVNYDMMGQYMLFALDGEYYVLLANDILAVYVAQRKFVPAPGPKSSNAFLEEIPIPNGELYVRRVVKNTYRGKSLGYDMYSETNAVSTVGTYYHVMPGLSTSMGMKIDLVPAVKQEVEDASQYYANFNGKYRQITGLNTISKLFKSHRDEIKKYIDDNGLRFENEENIARALSYAFSLQR